MTERLFEAIGFAARFVFFYRSFGPVYRQYGFGRLSL